MSIQLVNTGASSGLQQSPSSNLRQRVGTRPARFMTLSPPITVCTAHSLSLLLGVLEEQEGFIEVVVGVVVVGAVVEVLVEAGVGEDVGVVVDGVGGVVRERLLLQKRILMQNWMLTDRCVCVCECVCVCVCTSVNVTW